MHLAILLLLTGLTISAVAIYYSVVGLAAIFSAAIIPIIIMGSALEVGKLVCASWLKANWERAPAFMKTYMLIAVTVLMIITSMGIFGFLSKAHNDQNLVSGDVQSKIAIYDEKIKTARDNIDANRKALKQMDEAVDQVMGRSSDEKGADKAVAIRRGQQKERARLQAEITSEQKIISQLSEERAPIAAEVRKVEAEVGPIKYIAKFIYGEHGADENMLEKAVTWIIILIVIVFDPLAVIMLLAAQMTFGWLREEKNGKVVLDENNTIVNMPAYEPDDGPLTDDQIEQIKETAPTRNFDWPLASSLWPFPSYKDLKTESVEESTVEERVAKGETYIDGEGREVKLEEIETEEPSIDPILEEERSYYIGLKNDPGPKVELAKDDADSELEKWNKMIEEAEKAIEEEKQSKFKILPELQEELSKEPEVPSGPEFPENPKEGDKFIRSDMTPPRPFTFNGSQWSDNETTDQKKNELRDEEGRSSSNTDTQVGYVQNSEQTDNSVWQRIKNKL